MVRRAVAVANEACGDRTVLVTGHDRQAVANACEQLRGEELVNEHYGDGLGTSIACGVRAVRDAAAAVVILLADQPLVTADHVNALIDTWQDGGADIVATSFAGTQGPPVLFGKDCFDPLCELRGDTGAKALFDNPLFTLTAIQFEPAAFDVDTPGQLQARER